jgi:hypothetical protein
MKWLKRGLIFDSTKYKLSENCIAYAKSPQAVGFADFIRVYFTSQKRTPDQKWISCPQFVDFSKDFQSIIRVSDKPVIPQGSLGMFDEHGIFPINVLCHQERIMAYTCGWSRRQSVSIDMAIGLAESQDNGESFIRYGTGGPIMTATINEPCMVGDPFVQFYEGLFHMWYIFGREWKLSALSSQPERIYKIAHATSVDGKNWNRNAICFIPDVIENECQALPSVIFHNGQYHMFFCFRAYEDFRNNKENAYRLGYAHSFDLKSWVRDDKLANFERPEKGWDSEMICYPNIFKDNGKVYLLYNGNEFGKHGFGLAELIEN